MTEIEKIEAEQELLKLRQSELMRQRKNLMRADYKPKRDCSTNEVRKGWIDTMKKENYNLAITLNFNPRNPNNAYQTRCLETFYLDKASNKIKEWWELFNRYHFGQKCFKSKKNSMNYIGIFEHLDSNIHCHLAMTWREVRITDYDIYQEEQIVEHLWKTVVNSGTVYIDKINNDNWFYYMTKEDNFYNKMIMDKGIISIRN